jgi:hypothetical protein
MRGLALRGINVMDTLKGGGEFDGSLTLLMFCRIIDLDTLFKRLISF